MDLAGDLGGEAAYGGAAQAVLDGEADGDTQAHEVEVGGEDVVAVHGRGRSVGEGGTHLGKEAEGEGVAGIGAGEGAVRDAVTGAGLPCLVRGEVVERYAGRKRPGRPGHRPVGAVQQVLRELGARPLPVLRPARHHQPRPRHPQPLLRALGPLREAVGQDGGHLLRAVQEEQEGAAGGTGEAGQAFRGRIAQGGGVAGGGRRHDAGRSGQGPARGVGDRGVVALQVGAAQPQRGSRFGAAVPAGGQGREFRRTTAAGAPDQAQYGRPAPGEGAELPCRRGPFDRGHRSRSPGAGPSHLARRRPGRTVLPDRRGRQLQYARRVEVGTVRRHRRRVLGEQRGQRAVGAWAQRDGEDGIVPAGLKGRAEDAHDDAGTGVEYGPSGRPAAQPQRVPAGRADRQLQGFVETTDTVRRRVRRGHLAQHPRLPPATGRDPDVRTGLDLLPQGHRQRFHAQPLGAYEGQAEVGQRGHRGRGHLTATVAPGGAQHQPGQPVDDLMAGDDRAAVVGHEAEAAGPSCRVVNAHQSLVADPGAQAVTVRAFTATGFRSGAGVPPGPTEAVRGGPGTRCVPQVPDTPPDVPRAPRIPRRPRPFRHPAAAARPGAP